MGERLFKLLDGEVAPVRLGKRQPVVLHVIAIRALDLLDGRAPARDHGDHVDPENVLHPAARHRAVVLLGESVQLVGERGCRRPGIDRLLARRDDVDAADDAALHRLVNVRDKAKERDDGDVGVALVEHPLRVVGNSDARLDAELRKVAHVHADYGRVDVDGAHDLRALFVQVAQNVLAHLAAAVLYHSDLLHNNTPYLFFGKTPLGKFPPITVSLYQNPPISSMGRR